MSLALVSFGIRARIRTKKVFLRSGSSRYYYRHMKLGLPVLVFLTMLSVASAADSVRWFHNIDAAVAESRKTGKPIFVDVYADWCAWCHKLDKEVYVDTKFVSYIRGFVALKVDSE